MTGPSEMPKFTPAPPQQTDPTQPLPAPPPGPSRAATPQPWRTAQPARPARPPIMRQPAAQPAPAQQAEPETLAGAPADSNKPNGQDWAVLVLSLVSMCCYFAGIAGFIWASIRILHLKAKDKKVPTLAWINVGLNITTFIIGWLVYKWFEGQALSQL